VSFRLCKRRRFIQLSASLGVELAVRLSTVARQAEAAEINLQPGYAAAEGIRLYYVRAGEGPLMLFLHGFPDDWTLYRPYLLEFRQDHLAVAPNLRGVRPSDQPEEVEAYAMSHLLGDLHSLLDHFGRERCILVANDWGAYIAWVFASAYPDRVERLVIMNGAHPMLLLRDYRSSPAQIAASQYERHLGSAPAPYPAYVLADPIKVPASIEEAADLPTPNPAEAFFKNVAKPPVTTSLVVKVPTLVIWGMKDSYQLPGLLEDLGVYVPDLTLLRIEEAGHYPMQSHAEEVIRAIRGFIQA
jgi:epoxide hydrolase 4